MRGALLAVVVVLLALGAIAVIQLASREATLLVGGVLTILSASLIVVARAQLGTAFSVSPQAKALVTHGLYRRIPHPLYVFLDLALLGLVILLRQAWLLIVWALLVAVHAWASRREARVLEEAFGGAYREYRRRTWW